MLRAQTPRRLGQTQSTGGIQLSIKLYLSMFKFIIRAEQIAGTQPIKTGCYNQGFETALSMADVYMF